MNFARLNLRLWGISAAFVFLMLWGDDVWAGRKMFTTVISQRLEQEPGTGDRHCPRSCFRAEQKSHDPNESQYERRARILSCRYSLSA